MGNVADRARSRAKVWVRSKSFAVGATDRNGGTRTRGAFDDIDASYRLTRLRTLSHLAVGLLPPVWREWAAERFLRRPGAPGPASEHVMQYLLSAARRRQKSGRRPEATVVKGADSFYEAQYRQYLNPTMGAFAMTSLRALLAAGSAPRGLLWWRRRKTFAAMLDETAGVLPIMVISHQTVAVPMLLPLPNSRTGRDAAMRWLLGRGVMPVFYRELVVGEEVNCAQPNMRAREQRRHGALLELLECVIKSRKLALLALHPHDPDAMGLHITLFATQILEPRRLEEDYGLPPTELDAHRKAASDAGCLLVFCVGGTEEVFTQCSQNLFVKRPIATQAGSSRPLWPNAWNLSLSLERLFNAQFETFQVTVSASGLPGASPRNGDRGKAAFVGRRGGKTFILIPYHPGNFIHGHTAKLWSNNYGSLMIFDDHTALTAVTIYGAARVVSHETVERDFAQIAREVVPCGPNDIAAQEPEYWYVQEVAELVQQIEPLAPNSLDPQRPTCSISAGGHAKHGKKPAYFAASSLKPYDRVLQHAREAAGRPIDPTGFEHRQWNERVQSDLDDRRAHLKSSLGQPTLE